MPPTLAQTDFRVRPTAAGTSARASSIAADMAAPITRRRPQPQPPNRHPQRHLQWQTRSLAAAWSAALYCGGWAVGVGGEAGGAGAGVLVTAWGAPGAPFERKKRGARPAPGGELVGPWARLGRAVVGVGRVGFVLLTVGKDCDGGFVHAGEQRDHRQDAGLVAQLPGEGTGVEVEPSGCGRS